jgi:hypothetical protein
MNQDYNNLHYFIKYLINFFNKVKKQNPNCVINPLRAFDNASLRPVEFKVYGDILNKIIKNFPANSERTTTK